MCHTLSNVGLIYVHQGVQRTLSKLACCMWSMSFDHLRVFISAEICETPEGLESLKEDGYALGGCY